MIPLMEQQKRICQNPVKAIRQKCLDCSGWSQTEVAQCPLTECALYPFRFGKNPFRTKREVKPMSEERKAYLREVLAKARANRKFQNHCTTDQESESEESDMT